MSNRRVPRPARGLVLGVLVLVVAVPLDAVVHDLVFRYVVSHGVRLTANGATQLGTVWAAAGLLGGLAVVGHRAVDPLLWRASIGGLAGVAISGVASQVAKQLMCRGRPKLSDGWGVEPADPSRRPSAGAALAAAARSFFHWPCLLDSRFQSFPSGHATTAFAVAAALTRAAPARRPLWLAVAGIVGAARVLLNVHFLSDVLAGALLGWWCGRLGVEVVDRRSAAAPLSEAPVA